MQCGCIPCAGIDSCVCVCVCVCVRARVGMGFFYVSMSVFLFFQSEWGCLLSGESLSELLLNSSSDRQAKATESWLIHSAQISG